MILARPSPHRPLEQRPPTRPAICRHNRPSEGTISASVGGAPPSDKHLRLFLARNGNTLRTKLDWAEGTARCDMKKKVLLALFGILVVFVPLAIYSYIQVRATPRERARTLAGDDLISQPVGSVNHAITIRRPPHDVWPWLAQMGSGRGGWYAYDFIDNGGHPSAQRILPEYQNIGVGTVFPALPGATEVFVVAQCDPEHSLVLVWRLPSGKYQTTWAFALEQPQQGKHG